MTEDGPSKVDGNRKKTGGRKKGTPNKTTADARAAIALLCQKRIGEFDQWLMAVEDPAERCNIFLRALEYHVPKLNRTEVSGDPRQPVLHSIVAFPGRGNAGG